MASHATETKIISTIIKKKMNTDKDKDADRKAREQEIIEQKLENELRKIEIERTQRIEREAFIELKRKIERNVILVQ